MQRSPALILASLVVLAACERDEGEPVEPGLRGQLIDANEQPLAGVQVLACQATTCLYARSDGEGRFEFAIDPPADVALKTHAALAETPRRAAALVPVDLVDDALVELGRVYVPELPAGVVLGPASEDPQSLAIGDGLQLTLRSADLTPSAGEFLYDVAAVRVPSEHVPAYPELEGAELIAVHALHPFAATSSSPIGVRLACDLPEGSAVELRTINELDGNFAELVPGVVEGGFVTSEPGTGITRLTYLVVSR
ncbi:hypothetical protein ACNOYE_01315 [Nannocystaceae bacterium ST9]